MTAIARMPGNWPLEDSDRNYIHNSLSVPRLETNFDYLSVHYPSIPSASSSRDSRDELFFECGPTSAISDTDYTEMASYLAFEPVVESVSHNEPIDWRRYEPPTELLDSHHNMSTDIRSILPRSIERIQARHEQEERTRIASARRERPIARVGRASVKPQQERRASSCVLTSPNGQLDPSSSTAGPSRHSGFSATSLLSNDSGYASMLIEPELESDTTHLKPTVRRSRGFSALFRRKEKAKVDIGSPNPNNIMSQIASFQALNSTEPKAARMVLSQPAVLQTARSLDSSDSASLRILLSARPAPTAPIVLIEPLTGERECVSCLDDFVASGMVTLSCHSYCSDCFERLVNTALESETHWPAKCCLNLIPSTLILPYLDHATEIKYNQRSAEWSIPTSDRIYCHSARCSTWIAPKFINTSRKHAKCPKCSKRTCIICRGAYHETTDCPNDPNLQATVNLAEMEGWKRCYQCHAYVEHNQGCRHMTCRCKAQFCYICSAKWKSCECTDAQLNAIQAQVAARRTQANQQTVEAARREAEAEEEREILQMVADFEAAEAEREMERLAAEAEAQRLIEEAERRVREAERRRREEERIAAVNLRFRQLSAELELLNDVQRVRIAERHDFEAEMLEKDHGDALARLALTNPAEIQSLTTEAQRKTMDIEARFEVEYRTRLAEERHIENDYVSQLRAFYADKPDAEYHIRDARDELRRSQDKEYRFWDAYRKTQVLAVREGESRKMEGARVRHECEIKAVEGRAAIDEIEFGRRVDAEGRWVDVVMGERAAMLQEMEMQAYAAV